MDHIKPISVGRNAPPAVSQTAPVAQQEQTLLNAIPPVNVAPVAQQAPSAPTVSTQLHTSTPEASQQVVEQAGGCQMYFNIKPVTRIVLEMPWGFIAGDYICAFISSTGELVVCDEPPMFDTVNNVWVLNPSAQSIVLGKVAEQYTQYWRESVSFRPDTGYSEEDVVDAPVVKEEPEVQEAPKAPVLTDEVDYSSMSRGQLKRIKRKRLDRGEKLDDLPEKLRNA